MSGRDRDIAESMRGVPLLLVELDTRLAEPNEVRRRDRDRSVDPKDSDLELVAGLCRGGKHHAIGHVETLDRGGARLAPARRRPRVEPPPGRGSATGVPGAER